MCPPTKAHWRHLNTIELVLIRVHNPNSNQLVQPFFAQLTAVLSGMPGHVFPLIIAPSHGGPGPHLIHASLGPPESITQTASGQVQLFLHISWQCRYTLQWTVPSPSHGGSGPPTNTIPGAHPSSKPKQHFDRFSRFCTDDCRVSLYCTMGRPFPFKTAPSHWGTWTPSNIWFPGPTRVLNLNDIMIVFQINAY